MSEQGAAATAAGGLERSDREALLLGAVLALAGAAAAGIAASHGALSPWLERTIGHAGAMSLAVLGAALSGFLGGLGARWATNVMPSLWRNRRLVADFVRRDLRGRYAGASVGFFWSVVNPIVNLVVYLFVFRLVLNVRWGDQMGAEEVTLIMLAGIVVWAALAETLARSTMCMIDNSNLIQKVVFPAEVLPTYLSASALFNMTLALPVVLLGTWWVSRSGDYNAVRNAAIAATDIIGPQLSPKVVGPALHLGLPLVMLPLLYVLQFTFMVGIGMFLATLNVLIRDVQQLIGVATMVWMFGTPIFYPAEKVRMEGFGLILELNPMYWLIDSYRSVILYGEWPDWALLLRFALVALVVFGLGARFLARHKPSFPDLI